MMNLTIVYKFQSEFFVAGTFSCPATKTQADTISLQVKRAKYEDKLFIKDKESADSLIKNFNLKDFYPIKTYFLHEGYEVDDEAIDKIKEILGGAEIIWVNFQDSTV